MNRYIRTIFEMLSDPDLRKIVGLKVYVAFDVTYATIGLMLLFQQEAKSQTGLIAALLAFGVTAGSFLGRQVDRYRLKRATGFILTANTSVTAGYLAVEPGSINYAALVVSHGIFLGANYVASSAMELRYLASDENIRREQRGITTTLTYAVSGVAAVATQLAVENLGKAWMLPEIGLAILTIVSVMRVHEAKTDTKGDKDEGKKSSEGTNIPQVKLYLINILPLIVNVSADAVTLLFVTIPQWGGSLVSLRQITLGLVGYLLARAARRWGDLTVIHIGAVGVALTPIVIIMGEEDHLPLLVAIAIISGFTTRGVRQSFIIYSEEMVKRLLRTNEPLPGGLIHSSYQGMSSIGQIAGPLYGGLLINSQEAHLWAFAALPLWCGAFLILHWVRLTWK